MRLMAVVGQHSRRYALLKGTLFEKEPCHQRILMQFSIPAVDIGEEIKNPQIVENRDGQLHVFLKRAKRVVILGCFILSRSSLKTNGASKVF